MASIELFYGFNIKTYGSKTVVAGYHRRIRIFHPAVVKVAVAVGKLGDEIPHTLPSAVAKPLRFLPVFGNKNLSFLHVASVRNGVFIDCRKIGIGRFADHCNFTSFHLRIPLSPVIIKYNILSPSPSSLRKRKNKIFFAYIFYKKVDKLEKKGYYICVCKN